MRTFRDGEPRTATSTFTQLLSSEDKEFKFSVALRPERPTEFWGAGSPVRPPRFSHSSLALTSSSSSVLLYVQRDLRNFGDGEPNTATSTFTQFLSSDEQFEFSAALRPHRS